MQAGKLTVRSFFAGIISINGYIITIFIVHDSIAREPTFTEGRIRMCECSVFPVIDLPGTGRNIQRLRQQAGVTVRELQAYFGFEYPQAIYKWQHGECLPSVDNLLALARVLQVPMEDLLVYDDREVSYFWRLAQTYSAA